MRRGFCLQRHVGFEYRVLSHMKPLGTFMLPRFTGMLWSGVAPLMIMPVKFLFSKWTVLGRKIVLLLYSSLEPAVGQRNT